MFTAKCNLLLMKKIVETTDLSIYTYLLRTKSSTKSARTLFRLFLECGIPHTKTAAVCRHYQ